MLMNYEMRGLSSTIREVIPRRRFIAKAKNRHSTYCRGIPNFKKFFTSWKKPRSVHEKANQGLETYVCQMYGIKKFEHVNEARLVIFYSIYKRKKNHVYFHQN